jgi:hypothetical protein
MKLSEEQKEALLIQDDNDSAENVEITPIEGKSRDPLQMKKISVGCDYYSLTWACLKFKLFEDKYIRGQKIYLLPADYFSLYFQFVLFIIMLAITIILVIRNVIIDDLYLEGTVSIIICRIFLMCFAMQKMGPEFSTGFAKYLYVVNNGSEFTYPLFAKFVGLCQVVNAAIAIIGVLFFVCTADEFGRLLTCFSGLCVLTELDNWLGNMILFCHRIKDDSIQTIEDNDDEETIIKKQKSNEMTLKIRKLYNLSNLNEKLGVLEKMALIEEGDLCIFVNQTISENQHWMITWFENINSVVPWDIIIPLMTIPLSYLMPYIQKQLIVVE